MYNLIVQVLVPILLIVYGYRLKYKTPAFNSDRGFSTWRTRESEEIWNFGNKLAGKVALYEGIGFLIVSGLKLVILQTRDVPIYNYIFNGTALVCLFTIVPIVHSRITKIYGAEQKRL